MKLHHYITVALIFLLVPSVLAASFTVETEPIKPEIYIDEIAEFTLSITNNGANDAFEQPSSADVRWIVETDPFIGSISSGETKKVTLRLIPKKSAQLGPQNVPVRIKSDVTGEFISTSVLVTIDSRIPTGRPYEPSVKLTVDLPDKADPREQFPIEIKLKNRNSLDIQELRIVVKSDLFTDEYKIPLGPLEERSNQLLFSLDPLLEPGTHEVKVSVYLGNESLNKDTKPYTILSYSDIDFQSKVERKFFVVTHTLSLTNDGNIPGQHPVTLENSWFKSLFTKADTSAILIETDQGPVLSWDIDLAPDESVEITVVRDYRALALVIAIIIISIVAYFIFRSPVIVEKFAKIEGHAHEGVSNIKVKILLKNRGGRTIHNVKIIDKISRIAEFIRHTHLGTMQPTKVLNDPKRGTIIRWDIKELDAFEERIITYSIKSKLKIVGGVTLPPTTVKYDSATGSERSAYSSEVGLKG